MRSPTNSLGFQALTENREHDELWRWARKSCEAAGKEPTCHALVHIILSTPADQRAREVQMLNEAYAAYEEDHRRYPATLAFGVRLGSLRSLWTQFIESRR